MQPDGSCIFRVWAPECETMSLHIVHPRERTIPMTNSEEGYFIIHAQGICAGTWYYYSREGRDLPDPASFFQPQGVAGPSEVVDHQQFTWEDSAWKGLPVSELIFYEVHVGTFSREGTFEGLMKRLGELRDLGINALEIMPLAQFPGERNWGYDGVFSYAVQHSYGGPEGFRKLVNACHKIGMAVFLDVVYNHLGPEGNHLREFGPYFSSTYQTPWGEALNFDGPWSDGVRDFFSDNAIYWLREFHVDGLRFDAIHAIYDNGAVPVWSLLDQKKKNFEKISGRHYTFIAESDLNDPGVVLPVTSRGRGFEAQWLDDFHHALSAVLDDAVQPWYQDYGSLEQVAKALREGFVHSGSYVKARKRKFGASSAGLPGDRFVVFSQNHDQVGNRLDGIRLTARLRPERAKAAAALVLLSPYIPILFMGEEYGDPAPFYYFISHSDPELVDLVRAGRREEFASLFDGGEPPDPQAPATFEQSTLNWTLRTEGKHAELLEWYRSLIRLRSAHPAFRIYDKGYLDVQVPEHRAIALLRNAARGPEAVYAVFNLSSQALRVALPEGKDWSLHLCSNPDGTPGGAATASGLVEVGPDTVMIWRSG